jgi:hypothetical protein
MMALNKTSIDTERILGCSYGILCREPYEPSLAGHTASKAYVNYDKIERRYYLNNSLVWLVKRVGLSKIVTFNCTMLRLMAN